MTRHSPVLLICTATLLGCGSKKADDLPTDEAKTSLEKIYEGAKAYFESIPVRARRDGDPVVWQFPKSAPLTPAKPCCKQKGGRCQPDDSVWSHHAWRMVGFEISEPHLFQYQFISAGKGSNAKVTVRAVADKNCDGKYLVLERRLTVDKEMRVHGSAVRIRRNVTPPFK